MGTEMQVGDPLLVGRERFEGVRSKLISLIEGFFTERGGSRLALLRATLSLEVG